MPSEGYSIRVDKSAGIVEISGPDKDWIGQQLEKLRSVYEGAPASGGPTGARSEASTSKPAAASSADGTAKVPRTRRTGSTVPGKNPELTKLLTSTARDKLQKYTDERAEHFKKATEQVPIIAAFLADELSWDAVTADDLYTVFTEMGWKIPATRQALTNAQIRNNYFTRPDGGKYRLSHKGWNFARLDSKAEKKAS